MKENIPPLYPWQERALQMARHLPDLGLFAEMGCLTGDTIVKINKGGCSRQLRLDDYFYKFHNVFNISSRIRSHQNGIIKLDDVLNVIYSGVKEVIQITLEDGKKLKLTPEHEVLTDKGFVEAAFLLNGNVMVDNLKRYAKKSLKKQDKPRYNLLKVGIYYPYGHCTTVRNKKIKRAEKHRLIYEAYINKMELCDFIKKTNDPCDSLKFINPQKYHIHHKNHDHKDHRIENLECLPVKEHMKKHGNYNNFGHGIPEYSKCIKIEKLGKEHVYDISCAPPYHNFVANSIVVHNCGKSRAAIEILRVRFNTNKRIMRVLIISPLVTLYNWKDEIQMYSKIPKERIHVLEGTGAKRVKQLEKVSETGGIVILNYESIQNESIFGWLDEWRPEIIIADESHTMKNPKSKRAKKILHLGLVAKYRMIMTGTPILNSITDIFNQYLFLDCGTTFGTVIWPFQQKYMYDANEGWKSKALATGAKYFPDWRPRAETFGELNQKIYKKAIRVTKEECLKDLPPLVKIVKYCELSKEQERAYKEMKRDFITFVNQNKDKPEAVVAQLALTKALRLQQIISGHLKTDKGNVYEIEGKNPRLALLEELILQVLPKHKFIVWTCFNNDNDIVSRMLKQHDIKHTFLVGGMSGKEKRDAMSEFKENPAVKGIVANRHAGGVGVNLVEASYSFVFSRNFNFGDEKQSEARNHRGGSQIHERVTKVDIVARGTIDELSIIKSLEEKQSLSSGIIDLIKNHL